MNPINQQPNETVVEVRDLVRTFWRKTALGGVSINVPRGTVFGLVGENGAGKTTLMKHLLGLLKPTSGSVRVFGIDPVADPVGVLSRIGYLSEDRDLPHWMRVDELIRYTKAFYPDWDDAYAEQLRQLFNLPNHARVKHLSRGEKAKAGLLIALAYRPELLLLDEPSSGLDPVVRRDILSAIIRTVADEGRTVIFSSHLLEEVERVSDHVAMVIQGKIVLDGPMDDVKAKHHRVNLRLAEPAAAPPALSGALSMEGSGRDWVAVCDNRAALHADAERMGIEIVSEETPTLEDIFVARAGTSRAAVREG